MCSMGPPEESSIARHRLTMLRMVMLAPWVRQTTGILGASDTNITPVHLTVWALILASTTVVIGLADLLALARELNCAVIDID